MNKVCEVTSVNVDKEAKATNKGRKEATTDTIEDKRQIFLSLGFRICFSCNWVTDNHNKLGFILKHCLYIVHDIQKVSLSGHKGCPGSSYSHNLFVTD
uniref:Uncharacterized protein n=1 Tax=Nelumbo nucifera TaxID=4432 RepID=A0A822Z2F3_NELNU|nr:TPA_asm: hypothetical protein HUJ06_013289 [Nelumbo nucifera]